MQSKICWEIKKKNSHKKRKSGRGGGPTYSLVNYFFLIKKLKFHALSVPVFCTNFFFFSINSTNFVFFVFFKLKIKPLNQNSNKKKHTRPRPRISKNC